MSEQNVGQQEADERRLAELGYKQELDRSWSGFQNFAISFTIISILAAVRAGDAARALGVVGDHLHGTEHVLAGLLPEA